MDESTAETIQLIQMDLTQSLLHVLRSVSKGLGDIKTIVSNAIHTLNSSLGNVNTITQGLQREIQDVVEKFAEAKLARPQVSGQPLGSSLSQASHIHYLSSLESSHQDQAQISSEYIHFKKTTSNNRRFNPQKPKLNAEHINKTIYPKSECYRVNSRDVGQSLSLGNRISSAYRSPIDSFNQEASQQWKAQLDRPHVFSLIKNYNVQLLKSQNQENEKDIKLYEPLRTVKQYPPKLSPLSLEEVISQHEYFTNGPHEIKVRNFITFAAHTLQRMNATRGILSTEMEIVKFIQSEASKLANETQDRDKILQLSELKRNFQRFLNSRFSKNN